MLDLKKLLTKLCEKVGVIGTVYTAPWIATESHANSTQLTSPITIPAGTYILLVITPPASTEYFSISVAGKFSQVIGAGGGSFATTLTTTATSTAVRSAQSAQATFSYIERGSLTAIRIA